MRVFNIRAIALAFGIALTAIGLSVSAFSAAGANVQHPTVATESPRTNTPVVLDGTVYSSIQLHDRVIVAGDFTQVATRVNGRILNRQNLFAYDINSGQIIEDFNPGVNNDVRTMIASPEDDAFYLGGKFTQVDGQFRIRLAKIGYDGTVDPSFRPDVSAEVRTIELDNGIVYAGGSFTTINGEPHDQIGAVNATTGQTVSGFDLAVIGALGKENSRSVREVAKVPNQDLLLVVHTGESIVDAAGTHERVGIAFVDLNTYLVTPWKTDYFAALAPLCSQQSLQLRDASISPDGSRFAIGEKGNYRCDKIYAFDVADDGTNDPAWVTAAHDSVFSVEFTNNAVYAGGHFCFVDDLGPIAAVDVPTYPFQNKPEACNITFGNEDIGEFAARQQIVALNPEDGSVLDWNPTTNAIEAVWDIESIDRGIIIGQDSNLVGGVQTGRHAFFDFGGTTPAFELPAEPVLSCTADVVGDDVVLTWSDNPSSTEVIRRDGSFLATVTGADSFTDTPGPGDHTYILRLRIDGDRVDIPCEGEGDPIPEPEPEPTPGVLACEASVDRDQVTITWGDTGSSSEILRRDGRFLATVTGNNSYIDFPGEGDHDYLLRLRIDGSTVDLVCDPGTITIDKNIPDVLECVLTTGVDDTQLTWTANRATAEVIRRNGSWRATVTGRTSFTDADRVNANDTYELRLFENGGFIDIPCT